MQLVTVQAILLQDGYRVRLAFSDGVVREVDLAPYLNGPIFQPVREPAVFRQARIVDGSIAWPNGADIDPNVLRYALVPAAWEVPEGETG